MAIKILDFLQPDNKYKFLVLEAPVGTGKSLGALIPSTLHKKKTRKKVLYATSTINLQGQLMKEEIPLLKKMGLVYQPILAKGKAHYYCHNEYVEKQDRYRKYKVSLERFYRTTSTGHRDEFETQYHTITNKEWEGISMTATKGECNYCDYKFDCPTISHRNSFHSPHNDLIVTNHDQLIRSILNQNSDNGYRKPIVPIEPGIIIIDEAHDFQENFLGQSEQSIGINDLRKLAHIIPYDNRKDYFKHLGSIVEFIRFESVHIESIQGRYPIPESILKEFLIIADLLKAGLISMVAHDYRKTSKYYEDEQSNEVEIAISTLLSFNSDYYVSWMSFEDNSFSSVSRRFPTEFHKLLEYMSEGNKVIIMSGTLSIGGNFDSFIKQWRLGTEDVLTERLPTSFLYKEQAKIFIPDNLPPEELNEVENIDDKVQIISELIDITGGRSLILCTAKKYIDMIYDNLEVRLKSRSIALYKQGQSGVESLTASFKADETSVLIGSGSFFSGFSVPGKALISVMLAKLPFPVPDDPYLKLIGEGYEDEMFEVVYYPNMLIKLNQALGRLIRDISDYGVVTILDPRVYTKKYGMKILELFRQLGYTTTRDIREVTLFLKGKEEDSAKHGYATYDRTKLIIPISLLRDIEERKPIKIDAEKIKLFTSKNLFAEKSKTGNITDAQVAFCKTVLKMKNIKSVKFKTMTSAMELYKYLYNLFYQKKESPEIVVVEFPYDSEEQRIQLKSFKGSGVITYTLSPEEMTKYKGLKLGK
jgi:ATP-dependent DNA helicase DinG